MQLFITMEGLDIFTCFGFDLYNTYPFQMRHGHCSPSELFSGYFHEYTYTYYCSEEDSWDQAIYVGENKYSGV